MPSRSVQNQIVITLLRELAFASQLPQKNLEALLKVKRETISRNLNQLEALGLIKKLNLDENDRRLNTWKSSFSGLILVHMWLAGDDLQHPEIERIAHAHRDDWLIYRRYDFLKQNPNVLLIVNSYVYTYHPYATWRRPKEFVKTYELVAECIQILQNHPNQLIRDTFRNISLEQNQVFVNLYTRKVLGWDLFIESIVNSQLMMAFILYLMEDPDIRDFFLEQLHVEDRRYALIQEFRKSFFPETVKA